MFTFSSSSRHSSEVPGPMTVFDPILPPADPGGGAAFFTIISGCFLLFFFIKFSLCAILSRASISSFCGFDSSVLSFSFFPDDDDDEDARGVVDETNALLGDVAFALEKTTLPCEEEEEDE